MYNGELLDDWEDGGSTLEKSRPASTGGTYHYGKEVTPSSTYVARRLHIRMLFHACMHVSMYLCIYVCIMYVCTYESKHLTRLEFG